MEYYSYRLMVRSSLSYIKFNQRQIRSDLYSGLADALSSGDTDAGELGRSIILPSSYTGSPRQMFELYQDAMGIVRKYGKPDLFITFTCNPQWEEITSGLLLNQKASDPPDLIVRVFRIPANLFESNPCTGLQFSPVHWPKSLYTPKKLFYSSRETLYA